MHEISNSSALATSPPTAPPEGGVTSTMGGPDTRTLPTDRTRADAREISRARDAQVAGHIQAGPGAHVTPAQVDRQDRRNSAALRRDVQQRTATLDAAIARNTLPPASQAAAIRDRQTMQAYLANGLSREAENRPAAVGPGRNQGAPTATELATAMNDVPSYARLSQRPR